VELQPPDTMSTDCLLLRIILIWFRRTVSSDTVPAWRRPCSRLSWRRQSSSTGLVTTDDARELGLDPAQLRLLAARGKLERTGRGVYRVTALPVVDLLPYAEAVAWAHGPAAISHESALAMRGLGDFNPSRLDLTIAPNYFPRRPIPRTLRLWRDALPGRGHRTGRRRPRGTGVRGPVSGTGGRVRPLPGPPRDL